MCLTRLFLSRYYCVEMRDDPTKLVNTTSVLAELLTVMLQRRPATNTHTHTQSAYSSIDYALSVHTSLSRRRFCLPQRCFGLLHDIAAGLCGSFPLKLGSYFLHGCSRKSYGAVNLSQDFRLLSICPMLFCFRLFYFRFKSFLRPELKCAFTNMYFGYDEQRCLRDILTVV